MTNNRPSYGDEDPIAAAATPPLESALALVRTAGKGSLALLAPLFSRPEKLLNAPGNTVIHGWITDALGKKIDEALVSVYRAPKSYTGEEGADISCHGGIATVRAVLQALRDGGFREALPGEFTFRAFMNGKLDLTRAESVMELVSARSDRGRERAVSRLSGALEEEIQGLASRLKVCLAETELYLDYSGDDGIEPEGGRFPGRKAVETVLARLRRLEESYKLERICREGALTVIAGPPNAGKSSLFNLLLKEDRSLVTGVPGTTRDWIEAWVSLGGIPLRLADTAGLRNSPDPVERLGIDRSRELLAAADLVLYLIDGVEGISPGDRAFFQERTAVAGSSVPLPLIILWNKGDLCPLPSPPPEVPGQRIIEFSAKTGEGLSELTSAITGILDTGLVKIAGGGTTVSSLGIGTERQKELIRRAIENLEEALSLETLDLIAPSLRESLNALGEITGEVSTADILETMFSRFCVGK